MSTETIRMTIGTIHAVLWNEYGTTNTNTLNGIPWIIVAKNSEMHSRLSHRPATKVELTKTHVDLYAGETKLKTWNKNKFTGDWLHVAQTEGKIGILSTGDDDDIAELLNSQEKLAEENQGYKLLLPVLINDEITTKLKTPGTATNSIQQRLKELRHTNFENHTNMTMRLPENKNKPNSLKQLQTQNLLPPKTWELTFSLHEDANHIKHEKYNCKKIVGNTTQINELLVQAVQNACTSCGVHVDREVEKIDDYKLQNTLKLTLNSLSLRENISYIQPDPWQQITKEYLTCTQLWENLQYTDDEYGAKITLNILTETIESLYETRKKLAHPQAIQAWKRAVALLTNPTLRQNITRHYSTPNRDVTQLINNMEAGYSYSGNMETDNLINQIGETIDENYNESLFTGKPVWVAADGPFGGETPLARMAAFIYNFHIDDSLTKSWFICPENLAEKIVHYSGDRATIAAEYTFEDTTKILEEILEHQNNWNLKKTIHKIRLKNNVLSPDMPVVADE